LKLQLTIKNRGETGKRKNRGDVDFFVESFLSEQIFFVEEFLSDFFMEEFVSDLYLISCCM